MKRTSPMFLLLFCASTFAQAPAHGFVPDSHTAIRVAETALMPLYGEKEVQTERPFQAELHGRVWTVLGTTCNPVCRSRIEVRIDKRTGAVLSFVRLYK